MKPEDIREAMGWQQRHPALAVSCPHCRALPGQRCTRLTGSKPERAPHLARLRAAGLEPDDDPQLPPTNDAPGSTR